MKKNEEIFFKEMLSISNDRNRKKEYGETLESGESARNSFIQQFEFFILSNFKDGNIKDFFKWVALYERFKDYKGIIYTPGYLFRYYIGGDELVSETLKFIRGEDCLQQIIAKIKFLEQNGELRKINVSDIPWSMMNNTTIAFLLRDYNFFPFNKTDDNLKRCIKLFKSGKLMLTHFIGRGRFSITDPEIVYDIISHSRFKKYIGLNVDVLMRHCKDALNSKNINKLFEVILNNKNYLKILKNVKDILEFYEISERFKIKDTYKLLLNLI